MGGGGGGRVICGAGFVSQSANTSETEKQTIFIDMKISKNTFQ